MAVAKLKGTVELEDGTELEFEARTSDYVRYEQVSKKHGWGSLSDSPATGTAFIAWSALNRAGTYVGNWEKFLDDSAGVNARSVSVPPTPADPGEDSLSI